MICRAELKFQKKVNIVILILIIHQELADLKCYNLTCICKKRKDISAAVHAHPLIATGFAVAQIELFVLRRTCSRGEKEITRENINGLIKMRQNHGVTGRHPGYRHYKYINN